MRKKAWLILLALTGSLLWLGGAPSQAAGENWTVNSVNAVGCGTSEWLLGVEFSGLDAAGGYIAHTTVTSGGLVYMNENSTVTNGARLWNLYASSTYGPTTGSWPVLAGQPMKATFALERPKGTILSSWTMVAASCDSSTLLYNGSTAADADGDFIATPTDKCPTLASHRADGCPLRTRTLSLRAKSAPRRLVGRLEAPGFPALCAGRRVKIFKLRPGPDRLVATRTTSSLGKFRARLRKGRYYVRSAALIVPKVGETTATSSPVRRLR